VTSAGRPVQASDGTHVTNDPEGADRGRNVHSRERRNTGSARVENVVFTLESVLLAAEEEGKLRQASNRGAVDSVLAVP
jgi:hypothetical protein